MVLHKEFAGNWKSNWDGVMQKEQCCRALDYTVAGGAGTSGSVSRVCQKEKFGQRWSGSCRG